jgi:hypothetical protein
VRIRFRYLQRLDCSHNPQPLLRNGFAPLTQGGSRAIDAFAPT